jgi:hypothetical protein
MNEDIPLSIDLPAVALKIGAVSDVMASRNK